MPLIFAVRRLTQRKRKAGPPQAARVEAGSEGMRAPVGNGSKAQAGAERVFSFGVDPLRIDDAGGEAFEVLTSVQFSDVTSGEFMDLCKGQSLRVGMKVFEASSHSRVVAEFRAIEVTESDRRNCVRARFSIPRAVFADQQCRLAQVDLMYEGKLWFEQVIGAPPFLPLWVEGPPREVDVFAHYFANYAPK